MDQLKSSFGIVSVKGALGQLLSNALEMSSALKQDHHSDRPGQVAYLWVEEFSLAQASNAKIFESPVVLRITVDELALSSLNNWGSEMMAEIAGQRKALDTIARFFITAFGGENIENRRTSNLPLN